MTRTGPRSEPVPGRLRAHSKAPARIGTSGWEYPHWRGRFYPPSLTAGQRFAWYCRHFDSVEVNRSFYSLPDRSVFERWAEATPAGFVFAVKGSRYITHMKRLRDPKQPIGNLLSRAEGLGRKLGVILFQLPPRWGADPERLDAFLDALPRHHGGDGRRRHCYAFEFRDPDWFKDEVYRVLRRHGAAFCIFELGELRSPLVVTADFVYLRLHGPSGRYAGSYSDSALRGWARSIESWRREGRRVFCYFDNDEAAYAAFNASRLHEMVGGADR